MQFGRDPQIEVDVERVVMGDERPRRRAARDCMQRRGLDLEIAARQQKPAQRRDDPAAPAQRLAALWVHDQVEIALAVAQLDIGQAVIFLGQRPQRLRQHCQRDGVDGQLAARRPPDPALDADQIADIQEAQQRQVFGGQKVLVAEDLDLAGGVMQVDEHAAVADRPNPPGDADLFLGLRAGRESGVALLQRGGLVRPREAHRIGIDAHAAQRGEFFQPDPAKRIVLFAFLADRGIQNVVGAHDHSLPRGRACPATHDLNSQCPAVARRGCPGQARARGFLCRCGPV